MNLAALETATAATAVGLRVGEEVTVRVADEAHHHVEALLPCLDGLLAGAGIGLGDLDVVVVDVGPGRFTGLRVGVATAKGLHVATGAGLVAVTSTVVLAEGAAALGATDEVVAVVDVLRGEVAWARYRLGGSGAEPLGAGGLASPESLASVLRAAAGPRVAVGDGAVRYRDVLSGSVSDVLELVVPPPEAALQIARRRIAAGEQPAGHAEVHPVYGRDADAVANFAVRGDAP